MQLLLDAGLQRMPTTQLQSMATEPLHMVIWHGGGLPLHSCSCMSAPRSLTSVLCGVILGGLPEACFFIGASYVDGYLERKWRECGGYLEHKWHKCGGQRSLQFSGQSYSPILIVTACIYFEHRE